MRSSNVGDVADAFLGGANFGGGGGISPAAVSPSRVTVRTSPSENSSSTGWRPAPRSPRNEGSNGDVRVSHLSHGSRLGRRRDLRSRLTRCWCWATASSRHTSTNSPLRGTPGGSRGPAADRSDPTTSQRGRLIMPLADHGSLGSGMSRPDRSVRRTSMAARVVAAVPPRAPGRTPLAILGRAGRSRHR